MPVRLNGSTSGYVELKAPAVAGTASLELPTDSIKPGLVLVNETTFSAASSVSVNNCFSATYANYKILLSYIPTVAGESLLRFRASGSDTAGTNYNTIRGDITTSSTTGVTNGNASGIYIGYAPTTYAALLSADIMAPQTATNSDVIGSAFRDAGTTSKWIQPLAGRLSDTTQYDGFSIIPGGGGTITGTVRIYGYRNSL